MQVRGLFTVACVIAAISAMSGAATAAVDPNTLIGKWRLSKQVVDKDHTTLVCTRSGLVFAPDKFGWLIAGKLTVSPVSSYTVSGGNRIFVHAINEEAFTVIDHDTIQGIELSAQCTYTRIK